jgi:predicted transcriptional regulator of viral defense system
MKATEAYGELLRIGRPIVETREAAARLGLSASRASNLLRSLADAGLARRLRHGLWALGPDEVEPFRLAPYLTAPDPAYVSFWSALARHGLIEQIPRQIYVASPHQTQRIETALGRYSIHQIAPELFDGYTGSEETGYLATPEKALFDTIYLRASQRGQVFLPEFVLPEDFDEQRLDDWTARVSRPGLRTLVSRKLEDTLAKAARESRPAQ